MFRPNNGDQEREEERQFVQRALLRKFVGDQQLLYNNLPAFLASPELDALLADYRALQDRVHSAFMDAGYGAAQVSLEAATPPVTAPEPVEEALEDLSQLEDQAAGEDQQSPEDKGTLEEADADLEGLLENAMGMEQEGEEENTDSPVNEEENTDSPVSEEENTDSPVSEEENTDSPVSEEENADSPVSEEENTDSPVSEEENTDSPVNEEGNTDSPVSEEENTDSPVEEEENTDSPTDPTPEPPVTRKETPVIPVKLNLPNGKTGQEYLQKIDISPLQRNPETLLEVLSQGFEAAGLSFGGAEDWTIAGLPEESGKFSVEILLRFGADGDRPAQDYRLVGEIDILPDPRKLWKELEPDASLPYQKSHLRSALLHMDGRTMVAASRRGRSHAHSGTFRDDEFELQVREDTGWYILAAADGAGSATYSRRGSQIACDQAIAVLQAKLDERLTGDVEALASAWTREPSEQLRGQIRNRIYEALSHAAYAGYKAICTEAESLGEAPKAFHTTLMLTIVRQFDFGYFVGTWWVGDGAVGLLQRGRYHKLMGVPDGGQFAGQTRFLTMPEVWADGATVAKRIEFDVVEDFTAVVLMTDGVSDPKFHTDHNLLQREQWDAFWDELTEAVDFEHDNLGADEQLLDWLDFWAAGEHDDRTIAILF